MEVAARCCHRWPRLLSTAGHLLMLLWMAVWLVGVTSQRVFREDRLALLSGTLRTIQKAACDGELLRLQCPAGTTVSIQLVQYGRLATSPNRCGSPSDMRRFNYTDCMDRRALKVVVGACGGRRQCQLRTSADLFGVDPCPGIRKFVEVLYKCRPTEFRTKVVCQGERRPIYCDQHRVAIYSASFGTRQEGTIYCPQRPGVQLTDCQASFTSEKMISKCQGKPSCELSADPGLFKSACPPDHNMYLTTQYTCVPKEILKKEYATEVDEDYQQNMTEAPSAELEEHVEPSEMEARDVPPVDENGQERLILYLTLGITVCLLLCLGVLMGRLCVRRKAKHARSEPPPPGFATDLGRPDSELDLGMGRSMLGSGRLTPPHAGQSSFGPPPVVTGDLSRYQVPCRERERERESLTPVSHQTGPGDSLRSREANFGDSLRTREVSFGDSLRTREVSFGDNLLCRDPASSSGDSLRREVKFSDSLRGRDPGYGECLRAPREANFGSGLRSPARSDSLERMESSFSDSLRGYGSRGGALRGPSRTESDSFYFS